MIRYIALITSEAQYKNSDEHLRSYITETAAKIFSSTKLQGPLNSLNEGIVADFGIILENFPIDKCDYIFDSINNSLADNNGNKPGAKPYYPNKNKIKISDLLTKHFYFRDNRE